MGVKVKPPEKWEYGLAWSSTRKWEDATFNIRESKPAQTMTRETQ